MQKAVQYSSEIIYHLNLIKQNVVLLLILNLFMDEIKNIVRISQVCICAVVKSRFYDMILLNPF